MDSRTIKALEFGKVLEHLAGLCVSEAGRRVSLGLFPLRDADAVNAAHTLFDEVRTWSAHSGFRLSDFPDLEGLFPHLEKAAVSPSRKMKTVFFSTRLFFAFVRTGSSPCTPSLFALHR